MLNEGDRLRALKHTLRTSQPVPAQRNVRSSSGKEGKLRTSSLVKQLGSGQVRSGPVEAIPVSMQEAKRGREPALRSDDVLLSSPATSSAQLSPVLAPPRHKPPTPGFGPLSTYRHSCTYSMAIDRHHARVLVRLLITSRRTVWARVWIGGMWASLGRGVRRWRSDIPVALSAVFHCAGMVAKSSIWTWHASWEGHAPFWGWGVGRWCGWSRLIPCDAGDLGGAGGGVNHRWVRE